jgi:hypothetical protein
VSFWRVLQLRTGRDMMIVGEGQHGHVTSIFILSLACHHTWNQERIQHHKNSLSLAFDSDIRYRGGKANAESKIISIYRR